ncbi:hypothetical protein [Nitrospira sp. BLG_1]
MTPLGDNGKDDRHTMCALLNDANLLPEIYVEELQKLLEGKEKLVMQK